MSMRSSKGGYSHLDQFAPVFEVFRDNGSWQLLIVFSWVYVQQNPGEKTTGQWANGAHNPE